MFSLSNGTQLWSYSLISSKKLPTWKRQSTAGWRPMTFASYKEAETSAIPIQRIEPATLVEIT